MSGVAEEKADHGVAPRSTGIRARGGSRRADPGVQLRTTQAAVPQPLPRWRRRAPVQVPEVAADVLIPSISRPLDAQAGEIPSESCVF